MTSPGRHRRTAARGTRAARETGHDATDGTVVDSTTITGAATGDATVTVDNDANRGGDAEPYPVVLEIETSATGETCRAELTEGDDRIALCD